MFFPALRTSPAVRSTETVTNEVTAPTITSGSILNAPTLAYVVALATIASGTTLTAPTVGYQTTGATISSGSVLTPPTVAYAVSGDTIASGTSVNVPAIAYQVDGSTIASGSSLSAPTVAPGAVTVVSSTIASGNTLFAPTAIYALDGSFIGSGSALTPPSVAFEVGTGTVSATSQIFAPSLTAVVSLSTITTSAQLFGPLVSTADENVLADTIASGSTVHAPTTAYEINLPHISGTQVFAPAVIPFVSGATVGSTVVSFSPSITFDVVIVGGTIASAINCNPPTVAAPFLITLPVLNSTVQMFAPEVELEFVFGTTISSTLQVFAPTVLYQAVGATIPTTVQLFAPSVAVQVIPITVGGLGPTSQLFPPEVTHAALPSDLVVTAKINVEYEVTDAGVTCMMVATGGQVRVSLLVKSADIESSLETVS